MKEPFDRAIQDWSASNTLNIYALIGWWYTVTLQCSMHAGFGFTYWLEDVWTWEKRYKSRGRKLEKWGRKIDTKNLRLTIRTGIACRRESWGSKQTAEVKTTVSDRVCFVSTHYSLAELKDVTKQFHWSCNKIVFSVTRDMLSQEKLCESLTNRVSLGYSSLWNDVLSACAQWLSAQTCGQNKANLVSGNIMIISWDFSFPQQFKIWDTFHNKKTENIIFS